MSYREVEPVPLSQMMAAEMVSHHGANVTSAAHSQMQYDSFSQGNTNLVANNTDGSRPDLPNCVLYAFPPSMDHFEPLSMAFRVVEKKGSNDDEKKAEEPNSENDSTETDATKSQKPLPTPDSRRIRHRLTEMKAKLLDPSDTREEIPCVSSQWTNLMLDAYTRSGYIGVVKYDSRGGKGSSAEIWQAYLNRENRTVQYTQRQEREDVAKALVQKDVIIMAIRLSRNGTIYCSLVTEDTDFYRQHKQPVGPIADRPKSNYNPWRDTQKRKRKQMKELEKNPKTWEDYKHLWRQTPEEAKAIAEEKRRSKKKKSLRKNEVLRRTRRQLNHPTKYPPKPRLPPAAEIVVISSDDDDVIIRDEPPRKKRCVSSTSATLATQRFLEKFK